MRYSIVVAFLVACTIVSGAQTEIIDEFDDVVLDPRWEWYTPSAGPMYELDGEFFTLDMPAGDYDSWAGFDRAPRLRTTDIDAGQDFKIETSLQVEVPAFDEYYQTGLWVEFVDAQGGPIDGWFYGFYSRPGWAGNYTIRAERVGHRSPSSPDNVALPWGVAEAELKVERIADTYTFYYRETDGTPWETLHAATAPGAEVTHVGLFAKNWGTGSAIRAHFDHFVLGDPDGTVPELELPVNDIAIAGLSYCTQLNLTAGFPTPTWDLSIDPPPSGASPTITPGGFVEWTPALADVDATFTLTATATNTRGSAAESWEVAVINSIGDEFDDVALTGLEFYTPQTGPTLDLVGDTAEFHMDALGDDGQSFDSWVGFDRMPRLRTPLATCGDFAVETVLTLVEPTLAGTFHAGLLVSFSQDTDCVVWGPYNSGQNLRLERAGANRPETDVAIMDSVELGLRIERRGDSFIFMYREGPDGDWVEHWTDTYTGVQVDYVGVAAKNYGGTPPAVTMSLEYFYAGLTDAEGPKLVDPCPDGVNAVKVNSPFTKPLSYIPGTPLPTTLTVDGPGQYDPLTGVYSVTPDTPGDVEVTVRAEMAGEPPAEVTFTLSVLADDGPLQNFEIGVPDDLAFEDPPWELYDPAAIAPFGIDSIGDGDVLTIQVPGGVAYDHWTIYDNAPQVRLNAIEYPPLAGDFTIETTLTLAEFTTGEYLNPSLMIGYGQFQIVYWGFYQGTNLRLEYSGANNLHNETNTDATVTFRIRRACDRLYFYFKPQGGAWQLASAIDEPWPGAPPSFAGVILKTWGAGAATTIAVDYIDIFGVGSSPPVLESLCPDAQHFVRVGERFFKEFNFLPGFPGETELTVAGPGSFEPQQGLFSFEPPVAGSSEITITAETPGFPPVAQTFTVCALDGATYEEFDADFVDELIPPWDDFNPGLADPWPNALEDGRLVMSAPAGVPLDHWSGVNSAPQLRLFAIDEPMLQGDFTVETEIRLTNYLVGDLFHAGIGVGFGEDAINLQYRMYYWGFYNGTDVRAERSGGQNLLQIANFEEAGVLRIRKECDTMVFSFKPDSGDWVYGGTLPVFWPDTTEVLWVGPILKTYGAGPAITAEFEYFDVLQSDTCTSTNVERFRRGDANQDGSVNIADAIYLLGYLFGGGPALACEDSGDGNDDGSLNIADAISLLGHLFGGTGELPAPAPGCGADPTPDGLPTCVFDPVRCP